MLVVRLGLVVEDGVERVEVGGVRVEPGVDVLGLDVDDAAVVAGGGDFLRRLVGDHGEGVEVGLALAAPV